MDRTCLQVRPTHTRHQTLDYITYSSIVIDKVPQEPSLCSSAYVIATSEL